MKQVETVAGGRRANNVSHGSHGASGALRSNARGAYGGLEDGALLQRTIGNQSIDRSVSTNGKGAEGTGARSASPGLGAKVLSQIIERGMQQVAGSGDRDQSGNSRAQGSNSKDVIQRVMDSGTFRREVAKAFPIGGAGALFNDLSSYLQRYEMSGNPTHLRLMYKKCDQWALTPGSSASPGYALIQRLMGEIQDVISPAQAPTFNPAGTALGKTSNVTVDRTAKLTPEQQQAIDVIDKTNLHERRKQHAHDMIRNPDMIEQGAFGVCGLTSILFSIAKSTPVRFAEMIRDAWADKELVEKWLDVYYANGDPRHIELRAEVEYVTSQWLVRKSQKEYGTSVTLDKETLDQKMSMESESSKTQSYKEVFERQKKFSDSFELAGWENTLGHFALTGGALSLLLNGLNTGKPSYKIKRKTFEQDLAMVERLKGSDSSVIASVTNTEFYEDGVDVTTDYVRSDNTKGGTKPPKPSRPSNDPNVSKAPKYVHWVILKGAKLGTDGFYDLDIWTWRANYKARVHKDVIYSHIYSLVIANSKLW